MIKVLLSLILGLILCMGSSSPKPVNISSVKTIKPISSQDEVRKIKTIANVIYAEAGGQNIKAKQLVATVIWQRAKGDTSKIFDIVKMPKQFANPRKDNVNEWHDCIALAKQLHSGSFKPIPIDLSQGANVYPDHFYSGNEPPFWAREQQYMEVDGLRFLYLGKHKTS